MFSTRSISRTALAAAYSLALFALTCIASVAGDLYAQTISRGPYLQLGTPSSVIVRWRTDISSTGRVRYGNDAANLNNIADSAVTGTDHAVTLVGLAPDTRYYYSVGTTSAVLASGPDHKFVTSPPAGTSKPTRIWVIGDAGTGTASQTAVRNAYSAFNGTRETDLWLVLGDNAYEVGSDAEYQVKHFAIYPDMLKSAVSWYTLGNHDAGTGSIGSHPYHTMFSLPTTAQAGGVASGTENYYSFNYGNVHFVSLDSQETVRAANGAMASWLQSDLTNNTLPWVIAFWHHPPYSKGSHDSDTEINLVEMRSNFLPILEQHGVDLVLSGHSHSYERSYLLDGHYGSSSTLQGSMKKDAGDGRPAGTGAYEKPSIGPSPHEGAVYVVAGSSGQTSGFGPGAPHPAMYISLNNLGSLVLDLNGESVVASFLRETGQVADTFTLIKGSVTGNLPPDASITSPTNGASFVAPPSINLTANASDEGSVTQVAFYNGATLLGSTNSSPYTITWNNPPPGSHRLTARATDNGGATHISAPVFVTVNAPATAPAAPSNLAAGTVTVSAVPLTWSDNATNETGFEIERAIGAGGFSLLTTKAANSTSHTDNTVSPSTSYSYQVRAINGVGPSGYSNTVVVTTPAVPPPPPPAAPSNLQKTSVTGTQVALKWADKATNETSYEVERATGTGSFTPLTTLGANAVSCTDATVAPLTKYSYRVRAVNAGGNSAYSNTLSVTTPDILPEAPSGLSATAVAGRQIDLQWTDGASNETGFEIERSTDGTKFGRIKTVGVNVTTYANTGLTAGKTYWYRVRAINKAGDSAYSNSASAVALQ